MMNTRKKKNNKKRVLRWGLLVVGLWMLLMLHAVINKPDPPHGIPMFQGPAYVAKPGNSSPVPAQTGLKTAVPMAIKPTPMLHHNAVPMPAASSAAYASQGHTSGAASATVHTSSFTSQNVSGGIYGTGGGGVRSASHVSGPSMPTAAMSQNQAYTSVSLAARSLQGGMTAEQGLKAYAPRRVIIDDDDDYNQDPGEDPLNPGYNPNDPFLSPVGDAPGWLLLCCAVYAACCLFRRRKLRATAED